MVALGDAQANATGRWVAAKGVVRDDLTRLPIRSDQRSFGYYCRLQRRGAPDWRVLR